MRKTFLIIFLLSMSFANAIVPSEYYLLSSSNLDTSTSPLDYYSGSYENITFRSIIVFNEVQLSEKATLKINVESTKTFIQPYKDNEQTLDVYNIIEKVENPGWLNQPKLGSKVGSLEITNDGEYELDLTSYINFIKNNPDKNFGLFFKAKNENDDVKQYTLNLVIDEKEVTASQLNIETEEVIIESEIISDKFTSDIKKLTCQDGTLNYECSKDRPLYCDDGKLIQKCGMCGCPGNSCDKENSYTCQTDGLCKEAVTKIQSLSENYLVEFEDSSVLGFRGEIVEEIENKKSKNLAYSNNIDSIEVKGLKAILTGPLKLVKKTNLFFREKNVAFLENRLPSKVKTHSKKLENKQKDTIELITSKIGKKSQENFKDIFNGVLMDITQNEIDTISTLPGVKAVHKEKIFTPSGISMNAEFKGQFDNVLTGQGVKVAVIDTGVDYTNPDLLGCQKNEFTVKLDDKFNVYVDYKPIEILVTEISSKVVFNNDISCELSNNKCSLDIDGKNFQIEKIEETIHVTSSPSCREIKGYDFANDDTDPMDDDGHGTHVAGILGANGEVKGVAPFVDIIAYKVSLANGEMPSSAILKAIEASLDPNGDGDYSDKVDIISLSLGAFCLGEVGVYSSLCGQNDLESQALNNAVRNGVVAVVAGGNSGTYGSYSIASPGTSEKAITVGSYKNSVISSFSSQGPVMLQDKSFIKPDVVAPGEEIYSTYVSKCDSEPYKKISGTSMATPHVSGLVALLLEQNSKLTPDQIKSSLMSTAKDLGFSFNKQGAGAVDSSVLEYNPTLFTDKQSISFGLLSNSSFGSRVNSFQLWRDSSNEVDIDLQSPIGSRFPYLKSDGKEIYSLSHEEKIPLSINKNKIPLVLNKNKIAQKQIFFLTPRDGKPKQGDKTYFMSYSGYDNENKKLIIFNYSSHEELYLDFSNGESKITLNGYEFIITNASKIGDQVNISISGGSDYLIDKNNFLILIEINDSVKFSVSQELFGEPYSVFNVSLISNEIINITKPIIWNSDNKKLDLNYQRDGDIYGEVHFDTKLSSRNNYFELYWFEDYIRTEKRIYKDELVKFYNYGDTKLDFPRQRIEKDYYTISSNEFSIEPGAEEDVWISLNYNSDSVTLKSGQEYLTFGDIKIPVWFNVQEIDLLYEQKQTNKIKISVKPNLPIHFTRANYVISKDGKEIDRVNVNGVNVDLEYKPKESGIYDIEAQVFVTDKQRHGSLLFTKKAQVEYTYDPLIINLEHSYDKKLEVTLTSNRVLTTHFGKSENVVYEPNELLTSKLSNKKELYSVNNVYSVNALGLAYPHYITTTKLDNTKEKTIFADSKYLEERYGNYHGNVTFINTNPNLIITKNGQKLMVYNYESTDDYCGYNRIVIANGNFFRTVEYFDKCESRDSKCSNKEEYVSEFCSTSKTKYVDRVLNLNAVIDSKDQIHMMWEQPRYVEMVGEKKVVLNDVFYQVTDINGRDIRRKEVIAINSSIIDLQIDDKDKLHILTQNSISSNSMYSTVENNNIIKLDLKYNIKPLQIVHKNNEVYLLYFKQVLDYLAVGKLQGDQLVELKQEQVFDLKESKFAVHENNDILIVYTVETGLSSSLKSLYYDLNKNIWTKELNDFNDPFNIDVVNTAAGFSTYYQTYKNYNPVGNLLNLYVSPEVYIEYEDGVKDNLLMEEENGKWQGTFSDIKGYGELHAIAYDKEDNKAEVTQELVLSGPNGKLTVTIPDNIRLGKLTKFNYKVENLGTTDFTPKVRLTDKADNLRGYEQFSGLIKPGKNAIGTFEWNPHKVGDLELDFFLDISNDVIPFDNRINKLVNVKPQGVDVKAELIFPENIFYRVPYNMKIIVENLGTLDAKNVKVDLKNIVEDKRYQGSHSYFIETMPLLKAGEKREFTLERADYSLKYNLTTTTLNDLDLSNNNFIINSELNIPPDMNVYVRPYRERYLVEGNEQKLRVNFDFERSANNINSVLYIGEEVISRDFLTVGKELGYDIKFIDYNIDTFEITFSIDGKKMVQNINEPYVKDGLYHFFYIHPNTRCDELCILNFDTFVNVVKNVEKVQDIQDVNKDIPDVLDVNLSAGEKMFFGRLTYDVDGVKLNSFSYDTFNVIKDGPNPEVEWFRIDNVELGEEIKIPIEVYNYGSQDSDDVSVKATVRTISNHISTEEEYVETIKFETIKPGKSISKEITYVPEKISEYQIILNLSSDTDVLDYRNSKFDGFIVQSKGVDVFSEINCKNAICYIYIFNIGKKLANEVKIKLFQDDMLVNETSHILGNSDYYNYGYYSPENVRIPWNPGKGGFYNMSVVLETEGETHADNNYDSTKAIYSTPKDFDINIKDSKGVPQKLFVNRDLIDGTFSGEILSPRKSFSVSNFAYRDTPITSNINFIFGVTDYTVPDELNLTFDTYLDYSVNGYLIKALHYLQGVESKEYFYTFINMSFLEDKYTQLYCEDWDNTLQLCNSDWIEMKPELFIDNGPGLPISGYEDNFKSNKLVAFGLGELDSDHDKIPDDIDTDDDNDNITDSEDVFTCADNSVKGNIGVMNVSQVFQETNQVTMHKGKRKVLDLDLSNNKKRNCRDFEVTTEKLEDKNAVIVRGINLSEGETKTVYLDRTSDFNLLCIKDEEILSLSEISQECNQENEVLLKCPEETDGYSCEFENNQYNLSGLKHSGVIEFGKEKTPTPPKVRSSGGGNSYGYSGSTQYQGKVISIKPQKLYPDENVQEYSFTLSEKDRLFLKKNRFLQGFRIIEKETNSVVLFAHQSLNVKLAIGETKGLDLNKDGVDDYTIRLESIGSSASFILNPVGTSVTSIEPSTENEELLPNLDDSFTEDEVSNQEKTETLTETNEKGGVNFIFIFFILLIFGIIGYYVYLLENRKSLSQYVENMMEQGYSDKNIRDMLFKKGYSEKDIDRAFR